MSHPWHELGKKQPLTEVERVAIAAVLLLSTGEKSDCTMEQIYDHLLSTYDTLIAGGEVAR